MAFVRLDGCGGESSPPRERRDFPGKYAVGKSGTGRSQPGCCRTTGSTRRLLIHRSKLPRAMAASNTSQPLWE